jgi:hypothetical protein
VSISISTSGDPAGYPDTARRGMPGWLHLCVNVFEAIQCKRKKTKEKKIAMLSGF